MNYRYISYIGISNILEKEPRGNKVKFSVSTVLEDVVITVNKFSLS